MVPFLFRISLFVLGNLLEHLDDEFFIWAVDTKCLSSLARPLTLFTICRGRLALLLSFVRFDTVGLLMLPSMIGPFLGNG